MNRKKCTESKAEEKSVLEQYGLVNDLIEEIKALTLDYPDRKPQLINAIEQLNAMKAKRLGELSYTAFKMMPKMVPANQSAS